DPNAGNFIEFWREQRPLADTVATGENDRQTLKFGWSALQHPAPVIVGTSSGSALAVYGTAQAGTGFITVIWVEVPSSSIV
ncbi:MAG: hypothetical protein U9R65_18935, partial [Pseudomonadota bacterium]|nr:hypothetical protein [Pseudomonadota bacterium]